MIIKQGEKLKSRTIDESQKNPTLFEIIQQLNAFDSSLSKSQNTSNHKRTSFQKLFSADQRLTQPDTIMADNEGERACIIEISKNYIRLMDQLESFKLDKQDFEELHDYKKAEILMTNRFIKKEVIDMAD